VLPGAQPSPAHEPHDPQWQLFEHVDVCVPQCPHVVVRVSPGWHCTVPVDTHCEPHSAYPFAHTHRPALHVSLVPHTPVWHTPPQPSGAPHAMPLQYGTHPASIVPASAVGDVATETHAPRSPHVSPSSSQ
jgi:hypothetical protein